MALCDIDTLTLTLWQFLDKGVENIKKLYAGSVKLGLLTSQQADYLMSLLTPTTKYADLRDVDLVS